MNNYLNKKVEIREKVFTNISSSSTMICRDSNAIIGIVSNIYIEKDSYKFIELDHKILIALDYIYKIEIIS